ncbi:hypothetical protein MN0502_22620 [Arthrobacter sp. MN05-02]|nr:hypothetical protein MN0502_22620 [Arthrobacter sp. MN05-02]
MNGDAGTGEDGVKSENYGRLTLLDSSGRDSVVGPGQAQNLFNSDTTVSQELNLLRQGASEVINGNLLTLPIGGGIAYVQPVYVQSSGSSSFPVLRRVLVSFGDNVGFAPTLAEALDQVFGGESGATTGDQENVGETPEDPAAPPVEGEDEGATPTPAPTPSEGGTPNGATGDPRGGPPDGARRRQHGDPGRQRSSRRRRLRSLRRSAGSPAGRPAAGARCRGARLGDDRGVVLGGPGSCSICLFAPRPVTLVIRRGVEQFGSSLGS